MKGLIRKASSVAIIVLPFAAHGQIYICKDASGRTISSDRVSGECLQTRPIREMSRDGMLKREIPPELTPEQKRQKQIDEELRKARLREEEERRQFDHVLVARYPTEGHIEVIRQRTLTDLQEKINRSNANIRNATQLQKDLQTDSVARRQTGLSPDARTKWENADKTIRSEHENIQAYQDEIVNANQRFDAALKRYREINSPAAARAGAGAAQTADK